MSYIVNLFEFAVATYALYLFNRSFRKRAPPLPPGPSRLPLIGNLLDRPKDYPWIRWAEYKEQYGTISSLSIMGQNVIILNDQQSSIDLLEKRSSNYSDRPVFPFSNMCGMGDMTTLLHYGSTLTTHRKQMYQFVGSNDAVTSLYSLEEMESRRFVSRILADPKELRDHIRLFAGAIILKVTYGYTVDTEQPDPLVRLADKFALLVPLSLQPGKWIVDVFPSFRYLPEWLPGTGFKQIARSYKKCTDEFVERPHQFVKQQMAAGIASTSFLTSFLEQNLDSEEEFVLKCAAATMYAGGSDTSVSALYSLFVALQLYPEVQTRAQTELDSVVGPDRMPTFADRPDLPYVDAIVKEVLRWNSVLPLCIPHVAREDDIYEGYLIPKGSLVYTNIWQINHDPENFNDPYTFKPERFLGVDGRAPEMDPHDVSFGYGRRACPGKRLADASIFISVAMCLATLHVSKARDENGQEIEPKYEVTDSAISHPKPFECAITPRSAKARDLIMSIEEEAVDSQSDAKALSSISLDL